MTPDNAELAKLLGAIAQRDGPSLRRLYALVAPKLFGLSLRMLQDRSMAEDVMQDVFVRIWQNAASFSQDTGPAWAWMTAITRNRAIDVLRVKGPARATIGADSSDYCETMQAPGNPETDMTNLAALRHCLGKIEEPARSCVLLAYYEGYSREELAGRFDRPVNTIKTWLHRSLAALKLCLEAGS